MTKVVLLISAVFGLGGGLIFLARGNGFGGLIAAIVALAFFSTQMLMIPFFMKRRESDEAGRRMLTRVTGWSPQQLDTHFERQARFGRYAGAVCCLLAGIILFFFSIVVDRS